MSARDGIWKTYRKLVDSKDRKSGREGDQTFGTEMQQFLYWCAMRLSKIEGWRWQTEMNGDQEKGWQPVAEAPLDELQASYLYNATMLRPLCNSLTHSPAVAISLRPGDHGFEVKHTVEDEWVQEGVAFVGRYWPWALNLVQCNSCLSFFFFFKDNAGNIQPRPATDTTPISVLSYRCLITINDSRQACKCIEMKRHFSYPDHYNRGLFFQFFSSNVSRHSCYLVT